MHFVGSRREGPTLFALFLRSTNVVVHSFSRGSEIRVAVAPMEQNRDCRMDYADATLLMLADQLSGVNISTLDRRGIAFFRVPSGRALAILEP